MKKHRFQYDIGVIKHFYVKDTTLFLYQFSISVIHHENKVYIIINVNIYDINIYVSEILECVSDPCQFNSTCIEQVNGYTCNCTEGYNGTECETGSDVQINSYTGLLP